MLPDIVGTKLFVPRSRPGLVSRTRLTSRLDTGLNGTLTMISAPAGFGKTTLLADWLQSMQSEGLAIAWLSLEQGESEPTRFLRYLVTALCSWAPQLAVNMLPLLESPQPPPPLALLPSLVNELLAQPGKCVLVLDDYHVIENPTVHEALIFFVDHLPPQLHLVIASREDPPLPLARLRARGQLCELRVGDLRFTQEEAIAFLRDVMGLDLSSDQLAAIEARTEGWIAGLQLAALSMRDHEDIAGFIAGFTGRNRYVLDYLLQEVLNRLPPETRRFLQYTSILDRLSAPLCAAVLGEHLSRVGDRQESRVQGPQHAQSMLDELERTNLFLTPLDTNRTWYRYHQLFADLLRASLAVEEPQRLSQLHSAASAWYEANDMVSEAIEHALTGADFERASRLIGLTFKRMAHVPRELRTLLRWFQTIPPDVIRAHPHLGVDYAGALMAAGRLDEAEQPLQAAEQALHDTTAKGAKSDPQALAEHHVLAGKAALAATLLAARRGDVPRAIEMSKQALELLPTTEGSWRVGALIYLADAHLAADDTEAAYNTLREAEKLCRASGDDLYTMMVLQNLALLFIAQGRLRMAANTYRQVLQLPKIQTLPFLGLAHVGLGHLLVEQNDLNGALEHLTRGTALLTPIGSLNTNIVLGYTELARLQRARGDNDAARAALGKAEGIAASTPRPTISLHVEWARLRHLLATGYIEAAGRRADQAYLEIEKLPPHRRETGLLAIIRLWLAQGRVNEALETLAALRSRAEQAGRIGSLIEILVLQSLALHLYGDGSGAVRTLLSALQPAEPERYARIFLDEGEPMRDLLRAAERHGAAGRYAGSLLAQFPIHEPPRASVAPSGAPGTEHLVEPLTGRERDVLRLLASGLSGPEIASALVMTQNTVKTHLKNLYAKLDAHGRDQALQRARDLKLL